MIICMQTLLVCIPCSEMPCSMPWVSERKRPQLLDLGWQRDALTICLQGRPPGMAASAALSAGELTVPCSQEFRMNAHVLCMLASTA